MTHLSVAVYQSNYRKLNILQSNIRHKISKHGQTYAFEHLSFSNGASPYRSNAYLGFPTPDYPEPNHFHLPKGSNKFVPIRRSKSLTEVFSNEKYSKLLDNTPLILPYAGRIAPVKKLNRTLFYDGSEEEHDNPFNSFDDDTDGGLELSSLHCNLLKEVDEKIDQIRTQPSSDTFIKRISSMDYNNESPLNMEVNNNHDALRNLNHDKSKYKTRKTFERLNTLEQAIIVELERGKLDRSEGTIFHKIEHEIKSRNKLETNYKKWECNGGDSAKEVERSALKSSTPYASKIPVFRPATVPKVNSTKFKAIQKNKPRNLITRTRKNPSMTPTHEKEKSSLFRGTPGGPKMNHSAIFGKNPFGTENKEGAAFKLKEKGSASSLWVPIASEKKPSSSSRTDMHTASSSSSMTDFVEHQTSKIKDLGSCQNRMKEDIKEILSIHENIESNVNYKSKSKALNK